VDPVAQTLPPQPLPVLMGRDRRLFVISEQESDPAHGCPPQDRPLQQLLDSGMVVLDKPRGPTSHQVAAWLRDLLGVPRTGHGGTLDPKVSGVLPVTLGSATRSADALLTSGKEYVAVVRLHADVPEEQVRQTALRFIGKVRQVPPVRSAVARRERIRRIYYLDVLDVVGRDVLIRVGCEAGTYIRNLAVDIGRVLGPGAHLAELRRSRTGIFSEKDAVTLHDVKDAMDEYKESGDEAPLRRIVLPFERALAHLPLIRLRDSAVDAVCHGAALAAPGVAAVEEGIEKGDPVLLATGKGEAVAMGIAENTTKGIQSKRTGIVARAERVFMQPGTYPSSWRKGRVETRRVE
jgi:H/ACA ribonucleoprotein complex subunit 4